MRTVRFDGDDYWLRIPTKSEWQYLYHALFEKNKRDFRTGLIQASSFLSLEIVLVDYRFDQAEIIESAFADDELPMPFDPAKDSLCSINRNGEAIVRKQVIRDFLPCLIPLDKNGQPIARLFGKNNPNGSIVYGGELWTNQEEGAPKRVFPTTKKSPVTWKDYLQIQFQDTQDNPMEWIVLDGRLFATKPVLQVAVEDLNQIIEFF